METSVPLQKEEKNDSARVRFSTSLRPKMPHRLLPLLTFTMAAVVAGVFFGLVTLPSQTVQALRRLRACLHLLQPDAQALSASVDCIAEGLFSVWA